MSWLDSLYQWWYPSATSEQFKSESEIKSGSASMTEANTVIVSTAAPDPVARDNGSDPVARDNGSDPVARDNDSPASESKNDFNPELVPDRNSDKDWPIIASNKQAVARAMKIQDELRPQSYIRVAQTPVRNNVKTFHVRKSGRLIQPRRDIK
jgi:hypothetical protein